MKWLGLSVVVALGLVVGLLWTRDHSSVPAGQISPSRQSSPQSRRAPSASSETHPRLVKQERPTLEPTATDPQRRKAQEELWQELRRFASEAKLTDAQWEQFERDLSELAAADSAAWTNGVKTDFDGVLELSNELEHELEVRSAAYMTKMQVSELRFRFLGLVTRVRQLYFVGNYDRES